MAQQGSDQPTANSSLDRVQRHRAKEREIEIDVSRQDRRRRGKCKNNPIAFCKTYFPNLFYNDFTANHKQIIREIHNRIKYGGKQSIAAPRGDGKTTITKALALWALLYGHIKWLVVVGANGVDAKAKLEDIKYFLEMNDLLRDDFPEVCDPIRALEGSPQKANKQTYNGSPTNMLWSKEELRLPEIEGSPASGAIITPRGVDAAIRGLVRGEKRPDLVICDDIETRSSAESDTEIRKRGETILKDILGLGGQDRQIAVLLLCTRINEKCLATQYTDKTQKPEWNGIVQRWLEKWPSRPDLWDKYLTIRREGMADGDLFARQAMDFYKSNQKEMDCGVKVSNHNRFDANPCPDGSPKEISSIQAAYNIIAGIGENNFSCEYQNDPPKDEAKETSNLTADIIQRRISGLPRGVVPTGTELVTVGFDIGGRVAHWVAIAWRSGLRGHIIDYGAEPINSPLSNLRDKENHKALDAAIIQTMLSWRDWAFGSQAPWIEESTDKPRRPDAVMIDCGYRDKAIYRFVKSCADNRFHGVKGFGSNQPQKYREPNSQGKQKAIGYHYWRGYQSGHRIWLNHVDVDYWKLHVQNAFMIPEGGASSLHVFGSDPYTHRTYARHIVAEQ